MIDARCLIATSLGVLKDGSGLSESYVQEGGLITYRGTWQFDGILSPVRGDRIQMAYARPQYGASGLLTRFWPRLHVIKSYCDPYAGTTTVQVGCRLELMRELKPQAFYRAKDHPPAWWSEQAAVVRTSIPPPIKAQALLEFCLSALGISLAAGVPTTPDWYLIPDVDLSQGYVQLIGDILESNNMRGWMNPAGDLEVERISLTTGTGPVLTREELETLQPIDGGQGYGERVVVTYESTEAGNRRGLGGGPTLTGDLAGLDSEFIGAEDPGSDGQGKRDWELEAEESPTQVFTIDWTDSAGIKRTTSYSYRPRSRTVSTYVTIPWRDREGRIQFSDQVARRVATTYTCFAAANSSYGQSLLEAGLGFAGGNECEDVSTTTYEYVIGPSGPRVSLTVQEESQSEIKFAGSLSISQYVLPGGSLSLGTEQVITGRVETRTEVDDAAGTTKTATTRYKANGLKQSGNQGSAGGAQTATTVLELAGVVEHAKPLVSEGTEVRLSIGRDFGTETRPSAQDRAAAELSSDGATTGSSGSRGRDSQTVEFSMSFGAGSSPNWSAVQFSVPLAPDDWLAGVLDLSGRIARFVIRGGARTRALEYGRIRNSMEYGHANGVQITTAPWLLPSRPFQPVWIDAAGLSTGFRVNGRNWEVRQGRMVVSADLMLVGTVGRLTGATPIPWMPLPADPMVLNALGAPSGSGALLPANTITMPGGFNPAAPGSVWTSLPINGADTYGPYRTVTALVPPMVESLPLVAVARSVAEVRELPYSTAVIQETITAVSRSKSEVADHANRLPFVSRTVAVVTETIIGGGDFPVTVTVGGIDYELTTLTGNWATVQTALEAQPWWADATLALNVAFALAQFEVGFGLNGTSLLWNDGSFSGLSQLDAAPYFAFARDNFVLNGTPTDGLLLRGFKGPEIGDKTSPTDDGEMMVPDPDSAVWAVVVP